MHLLDTDTLTYLHAGHSRVIQHLRGLDDPDVGTTIIRIASIALTQRATLVTRNQDHFRQIPGLKIVNWVD
jgi:tRNA(fMet)-specific endonuclease VapC